MQYCWVGTQNPTGHSWLRVYSRGIYPPQHPWGGSRTTETAKEWLWSWDRASIGPPLLHPHVHSISRHNKETKKGRRRYDRCLDKAGGENKGCWVSYEKEKEKEKQETRERAGEKAGRKELLCVWFVVFISLCIFLLSHFFFLNHTSITSFKC